MKINQSGRARENTTASPRRWERRLDDPGVTARREEFNRNQGSPQGASTKNADADANSAGSSMKNADADANSAGSSMNNADADAKSAAPERWSNTKRAKTAANSEEPRNMNNDETAENSNAPPTSKCENHPPAAQVVQVLRTYVSALRTLRGRDGETIQLLALGNDLTGLFYQLPSDMNGDADEDDGSEDDNEEVDDEGDEVADEEMDDEVDDTPTTFAVGDSVFGYSPDGAEGAGWYRATVVAAVPGPRGVAPEQGERYGILYNDGESGADMRLCDVGHPDNFTDEDDEDAPSSSFEAAAVARDVEGAALRSSEPKCLAAQVAAQDQRVEGMWAPVPGQATVLIQDFKIDEVIVRAQHLLGGADAGMRVLQDPKIPQVISCYPVPGLITLLDTIIAAPAAVAEAAGVRCHAELVGLVRGMLRRMADAGDLPLCISEEIRLGSFGPILRALDRRPNAREVKKVRAALTKAPGFVGTAQAAGPRPPEWQRVRAASTSAPGFVGTAHAAGPRPSGFAYCCSAEDGCACNEDDSDSSYDSDFCGCYGCRMDEGPCCFQGKPCETERAKARRLALPRDAFSPP